MIFKSLSLSILPFDYVLGKILIFWPSKAQATRF